MKPDLLHALFHDIGDYGSVRIKKGKLLWMLGRQLETPTVWDMLMREWREAGYVKPLYGLHWGDEITLAMGRAENIAKTWTSRRDDHPQAAPQQLTLVS